MLRAKLGISPIAWWNDDDVNLSDDVSLDEALRQASVAGFTGMETGQRFPMNMAELGPILNKHNMQVCGGWFSGDLLTGDLECFFFGQLVDFTAFKAAFKLTQTAN